MKNPLRLTANLSIILAITLFLSSCGKDALTPTIDTNDLKVFQNDETACVDIELYVYLEGAYTTQRSEMTTNLNTLGLLPGQTLKVLGTPTPDGQPYNNTPWNYAGKEGDNWTDDDYTGNETDWILVSFRTGEAKNTEVGAAAALVNKDGSVTFVEDNCVLSTDVAAAVYIVVEHRNHMGIMTSDAVNITDGKLSYDFRVRDSYRNGTEAGVGQKEIAPGVWAMFAGDADQTDAVSYDINGGDNIWPQYNGAFGIYLTADLNLDGEVNGADKHIWMANNGFSSRVPK